MSFSDRVHSVVPFLKQRGLYACRCLNSPQHFLKPGTVRFHQGLVYPRAPLGSPNGTFVTDRILCEHSEVGVAISLGEFGISAGSREFSFRARLEFNITEPAPRTPALEA